VVLVGAAIGTFLVQYGLPNLPFGEDALRSHERFFWMLLPGLLAALASWRHALVPLTLLLPLVILDQVGGWSLNVAALTPRLLLPLAFVLVTLSGDLTFRRRPGFEGGVQLGLLAGVAAGAIGATGSAAYATWAGALGIAWGLCVLLAWRRWNAGLLDGASLMMWSAGFLLMATRYSDLTALDAGLLSAALPLSLFCEELVESERAKRLASWGCLLLVIGLVALRIALSWESDPYAGY